MRRSLVVLALLLLVAISAHAQTQACPGLGKVAGPYAFETLTVSTTALGFTTGTLNAANALMVLVTTETDSVRWRDDGTAPTSSVGHVLPAGSAVLVCGASIPKIKFIKSGTSSVPVSVTYYK